MATLQTTVNHFARGHAILELTPNSPAQREFVDTYAVRLTVHDRLVYDRIQSVRPFQMRHYYVEQIAKACCYVSNLLDRKLPDPDDPVASFPMCTRLDTDWLAITLSAASTKQFGELVGVRVYLEQAKTKVGDTYYRSRGQWGEWQELVGAVILCAPSDCIAFGRQLLDEVRTVEATRIALGIPDVDDES